MRLVVIERWLIAAIELFEMRLSGRLLFLTLKVTELA